MKRLLLATLAVLCIGTAGFSQTTKSKTVTTTATQSKPVAKKEVTHTSMKPVGVSDKTSKTTMSTTATTTSTAIKTKTKKDGTPDKRFKENKTTTVAATPKKKDGTPDMRYKANKKKG